MNWKLGRQMQDGAGGVGLELGCIDLINCARQPIKGCIFSGVSDPCIPTYLLGCFILGGKG